jgi:hypothetical protein
VTVSPASGSAASGSAARAGRTTPRVLGGAVFAALVVATIGAFFISQHLKVTTPYISGVTGPSPPSINPIDGPKSCRDSATGRDLSERSTTVSFYVVHHADDVDVYVVNQSGNRVRTVATGVSMYKSKAPTPHAFRAVTKHFSWNGRDASGRLVAPGAYFFRVHLVHQQRTIELQQSVRVDTTTGCV